MNVFELTRALIDIESITGNEEKVGEFLERHLSGLASRFNGKVERMEAEPHRFNVFAQFGERPVVTMSTHMDTVPPFFPSREDDEFIWGRAAADTKGIIASMITAAERLLERGGTNLGLLFVVGEERDSIGAARAAKDPRGSRFLINGEPTENKLALGSKGSLRIELHASGRMAHSAYPELGESAIEKLLTAIERLRAMELPVNPEVGFCTMNIGIIEGGRAPNVIADQARAQLLYRLVGPSEPLRAQITAAIAGLAEAEFVLEIPFVKLRTVPGIESMVAKFTTDIPWLSQWGVPVLIGPGSIHVAHTEREFISKKQLHEAVDLYCAIARDLLKT